VCMRVYVCVRMSAGAILLLSAHTCYTHRT